MASQPYDNVIFGTNGMFYGTTYAGGTAGYGTVFRMDTNGLGLSVLYGFGPAASDGWYPNAGLVLGKDGELYGVTGQGGTNRFGTFYYGAGALFKIAQDGSGYATLHVFGGTNDGIRPFAALIQGTNGSLYGTTYFGGTNRSTSFNNGAGTLFRLNPDGSGYAILHHFNGTNDGGSPAAALVEGSDGALYGTTSRGGTNSNGTLFKISQDGSNFTLLHTFGGTAVGDGSGPYAALNQASDLALYGTTFSGGPRSGGTVFKLNLDGSGYTVLTNFASSGTMGIYIYSGVIEGADGKLHGAASQTDISANSGNLFTLNKDGSGLAIIHVFAGAVDSLSTPTASLLKSPGGTLYGVTRTGGLPGQGTVFKLQEDGSGYSVLWSFSSTGGDAATPASGLMVAKDGTLFGTASSGGAESQGAVYRVNQDGTGYGIVFSFGSDMNGGSFPDGLLMQGSDLALYGTTSSGAAPGQGNQGTVFKLNTDGSGHTVLHSFGTVLNDGTGPFKLIEGSDGMLYGTTGYGGSNGFSGGILYSLSKSGANYTVLYQFGGTNGVTPSGALLEGSDHVLYGLTQSGGTNSSTGTLFKLNRDGTGYSVVYNFGAPGDGAYPRGLLEGSDGFLYGTAGGGGTNVGPFGGGTIFKMAKNGNGYLLLHQFGAGTDGAVASSLVQVNATTLYGTTVSGGSHFGGTVFQINTDGSGYAVVYNFAATPTDGKTPLAGLAAGSNGAVFGATQAGGFTLGTVFGLTNTVAQPTNHPPVVANPIPNQIAAYGLPFLYTFPANTFADPDAGQVLTYSASNLPAGIVFTAASRTFSGASTSPGPYAVMVTATDNGSPPLSTNLVFTLAVTGSPLMLSINAGGAGYLTFTGGTSVSYQVQATDTLSPPNWQMIVTQPSGANGLFSFIDTNAPLHRSRFYRTLQQ